MSAEGRGPAWAIFSAAAALILPAITLLLLLEGASVAVHERFAQPFYRLETAAWLAENTPPGSPVMLRDSELALYADRPQVALPNAPWQQVTDYARAPVAPLTLSWTTRR